MAMKAIVGTAWTLAAVFTAAVIADASIAKTALEAINPEAALAVGKAAFRGVGAVLMIVGMALARGTQSIGLFAVGAGLFIGANPEAFIGFITQTVPHVAGQAGEAMWEMAMG